LLDLRRSVKLKIRNHVGFAKEVSGSELLRSMPPAGLGVWDGVPRDPRGDRIKFLIKEIKALQDLPSRNSLHLAHS
jgi:hypothetical protein